MIEYFKTKYHKIFEDRNISEAFVYLLIYAVNRFVEFSIPRICFLQENNLKIAESTDDNFEFIKLLPSELKNYEYNLEVVSDDDIKIATNNGDILYVAILKNTNKIVSYGWYSMRPTRISETNNFSFPNQYLYMYKGFTEPEYRGFRLHAIGMRYGVLDAHKQGFNGLISYIYAENYRSIRSCIRLGYTFSGFLMILKLFNKNYTLRSPKAIKHQVNIIQNCQ